jgi:archaellum component FlaF (FlaF/FlaG flagellin family)
VQHANSASRASDTFTIYLNTTEGSVAVPNVNLNGRQSKIIVTNYNFGKHTLLYSTAEVLTYGIFDVDVLVLYLQEGQIGQFAFKNASASLTYQTYGPLSLTSVTANGTQSFVYTQSAGQTTIKFSDGTLIYFLDLHTAWQFWAPPTTSNPNVLSDQQIFVLGPYLIRSASINHDVVHISGDSNRTSTIEVYAGHPGIQTIDWNGERLTVSKTPYGSIQAQIPGTKS